MSAEVLARTLRAWEDVRPDLGAIHRLYRSTARAAIDDMRHNGQGADALMLLAATTPEIRARIG